MVNENIETYLTVLEEALSKKDEILSQLIDITKRQESIIKEKEIDEMEFNQTLEEKDKLIQLIQTIDDGFERIYLLVKEELPKTQSRYIERIKRLQDLIKEVMDKGVELQVLEKHNKMKLDAFLRTKRSEIKDFKMNNKTVSNYYKSISKQYEQESYFFDKKK